MTGFCHIFPPDDPQSKKMEIIYSQLFQYDSVTSKIAFIWLHVSHSSAATLRTGKNVLQESYYLAYKLTFNTNKIKECQLFMKLSEMMKISFLHD
jgi:hypothetical protein